MLAKERYNTVGILQKCLKLIESLNFMIEILVLLKLSGLALISKVLDIIKQGTNLIRVENPKLNF